MTVACTACHSPRTVRHATVPGKAFKLHGTRVEEIPATHARHLCRECGRTFVVRDPGAVSAERQVRDLAAELTFALGRAGAARKTGLGERVVDRLLRDWREVREPEVEEAVDFLLVGTARHRGGERVLMVDADTASLLDVLEDRARIQGWLTEAGRLPALRVCVPLDPAVAGAVREALPGAAVMVAPSAVRRAIRSAVAAGMAALRRDPGMRGRNGMPGTARVLRAHDGRVQPGEGWPREVLGLLGAARAASAAASAPDAHRAGRAYAELDLCSEGPGCGPLVRLMRTWRREILEGLAHGFVDRIVALADRIGRVAQSRRPALGGDDFRALLLMAYPVDPQAPIPEGRPLSLVLAVLGPPSPPRVA